MSGDRDFGGGQVYFQIKDTEFAEIKSLAQQVTEPTVEYRTSETELDRAKAALLCAVNRAEEILELCRQIEGKE